MQVTDIINIYKYISRVQFLIYIEILYQQWYNDWRKIEWRAFNNEAHKNNQQTKHKEQPLQTRMQRMRKLLSISL